MLINGGLEQGKNLIYPGPQLCRQMIREKHILSCHDGKVIYRYQPDKTKRYLTKTVSGTKFLWLYPLLIRILVFRTGTTCNNH